MSTLNLSAILQVIDRATAPMRAIDRSAAQLGQGMQQTRAQLRQLQQTQGNINSFRSLQQSLADNESALQLQRQRVQQLTDAIAATPSPTLAMQQALQRAQDVQQRMTAQTTQQTQQLGRLQDALRDAGVNTNNLGDAESRLSSDISRTNDELAEQRRRLEQVRLQQQRLNQMREQHERIASRAQSIGASAATGAVVGAMAMSVPIKSYAEAEDAATTLRVSMMKANGQVADQFKDINALATNLGNRLPGTTAEFQLMMAKLVQQGMSFEAILGGVGEAAGFLGVQLKMPFEDAAEFAAKMQDATKTVEGDMLSLMDVIQKSFYLGVDSTNMLSGFAKMAAGMKTIKAQGLEGAKAMAPLLIMADQAAMAGESAGNAYSKIFAAMMNTDKITKTFADLRKEKGINMSMNFTDGKGEFGGLDNMFQQLEKMKGMSTEARLPILSNLFGNDAETIQALNLLIDKGKAGYEETIAKMDAQADLQKRVNEQLGTLTNLWDAATGTFTNSMANFGAAIAPELKSLTVLIADISESIGVWAEENPALANTLMKISGGLVLLLAVVAILAGVLLAILGPIAALRMAFFMLNLSMTVNPIFILVLALTILLAVVWRNWDAITSFWDGLGAGWQTVIAAAAAVGALALGFRLLGLAILTNPIFLLVAVITAIAVALYVNRDAVIAWASSLIQGAVDIYNHVAGMIQQTFNEAVAWVSQGIEQMIGFFNTLWQSVVSIFAAIGIAILNGIRAPIQLALDAVNLLIAGLNNIPGINIPNIPAIRIAGATGTVAPVKAAGMPPLKAAGTKQTITNNFAAAPITINGVTDPKAVGAEVQRQLVANQRQQESRQRSALTDTE